MQSGGHRGSHSKVSIEKIRKAQTGRKYTEASKQKMREAQLGKKLPKEQIEKIKKAISGSKNYNAMRVKCLETGEIFGSHTEASESVYKDRSKSSRVHHSVKYGKSVLGYTWVEVDKNGVAVEREIVYMKTRRIKCKCIELDLEFESLVEGANKVYGDKRYARRVSRSFLSGNPSHGFTWIEIKENDDN